MSITVVAATSIPTPGRGDVTYRQLKRDLCTMFGYGRDPAKLEQAGVFIRDVIDRLNRLQVWNFNLVTSSPITITAGVSTYSIPSDFWRIYNARKTDDVDYPFDVLRQKTFDTIFLSQRVINGQPYVLVIKNTFRDGTVTLFPIPDGSHTLSINYYRLIQKPAGDDDPLDIPLPFQSVVKDGAMARMAAQGGTAMLPQAKWWDEKYEQGIAEMVRADDDIGDENLRLVNIEELASRWDYANPASRPRVYDLY